MTTGNRIHHINLMVDDLGGAVERCEADQHAHPAIFDEAIFEPEFLEAR
jgi:hypothetical protein